MHYDQIKIDEIEYAYKKHQHGSHGIVDDRVLVAEKKAHGIILQALVKINVLHRLELVVYRLTRIHNQLHRAGILLVEPFGIGGTAQTHHLVCGKCPIVVELSGQNDVELEGRLCRRLAHDADDFHRLPRRCRKRLAYRIGLAEDAVCGVGGNKGIGGGEFERTGNERVRHHAEEEAVGHQCLDAVSVSVD